MGAKASSEISPEMAAAGWTALVAELPELSELLPIETGLRTVTAVFVAMFAQRVSSNSSPPSAREETDSGRIRNP